MKKLPQVGRCRTWERQVNWAKEREDSAKAKDITKWQRPGNSWPKHLLRQSQTFGSIPAGTGQTEEGATVSAGFMHFGSAVRSSKTFKNHK